MENKGHGGVEPVSTRFQRRRPPAAAKKRIHSGGIDRDRASSRDKTQVAITIDIASVNLSISRTVGSLCPRLLHTRGRCKEREVRGKEEEEEESERERLTSLFSPLDRRRDSSNVAHDTALRGSWIAIPSPRGLIISFYRFHDIERI